MSDKLVSFLTCDNGNTTFSTILYDYILASGTYSVIENVEDLS